MPGDILHFSVGSNWENGIKCGSPEARNFVSFATVVQEAYKDHMVLSGKPAAFRVENTVTTISGRKPDKPRGVTFTVGPPQLKPVATKDGHPTSS